MPWVSAITAWMLTVESTVTTAIAHRSEPRPGTGRCRRPRRRGRRCRDGRLGGKASATLKAILTGGRRPRHRDDQRGADAEQHQHRRTDQEQADHERDLAEPDQVICRRNSTCRGRPGRRNPPQSAPTTQAGGRPGPICPRSAAAHTVTASTPATPGAGGPAAGGVSPAQERGRQTGRWTLRARDSLGSGCHGSSGHRAPPAPADRGRPPEHRIVSAAPAAVHPSAVLSPRSGQQ